MPRPHGITPSDHNPYYSWHQPKRFTCLLVTPPHKVVSCTLSPSGARIALSICNPNRWFGNMPWHFRLKVLILKTGKWLFHFVQEERMWCSAVSLPPAVFSAPLPNTQRQEIRRHGSRACWALGGLSVCIMAKVNASQQNVCKRK